MAVNNGVTSEIVQDVFADYLTHRHVMATLSATANSAIAISTVTVTDPMIAVYQKLCETSPPMPTVPQMERVWRALGVAEAAVVAGADAEKTARALTTRLKAIFASDDGQRASA